ncbi:hypothetical protein CEUSTIGMA_g10161.t1 [Chlamydomonas eustigma]|uniref:Uncharacterized protein n=1 Tax=Chlamydomonas eustigma TaxID=1157962 RepID=A0A250XI18_9CHLO|nr:hypothetical protein CEUSTIGMA_g10161.t1 [Chlamydomonas eustigma]|eukprot:GAX82735.1 hypothetical protein CEUSTIGMA_g10161.t1 [Chlamydomonas eustigma]
MEGSRMIREPTGMSTPRLNLCEVLRLAMYLSRTDFLKEGLKDVELGPSCPRPHHKLFRAELDFPAGAAKSDPCSFSKKSSGSMLLAAMTVPHPQCKSAVKAVLEELRSRSERDKLDEAVAADVQGSEDVPVGGSWLGKYINSPESINSRTANALSRAIMLVQPELLRLLLQAGGNPFTPLPPDAEYHTPAHQAVLLGQAPLVKEILQSRNTSNNLILDTNIHYNKCDGLNMLGIAVECSLAESVLWEAHKHDPGMDKFPTDASKAAVYAEIIAVLLKAGCNPHHRLPPRSGQPVSINGVQQRDYSRSPFSMAIQGKAPDPVLQAFLTHWSGTVSALNLDFGPAALAMMREWMLCHRSITVVPLAKDKVTLSEALQIIVTRQESSVMSLLLECIDDQGPGCLLKETSFILFLDKIASDVLIHVDFSRLLRQLASRGATLRGPLSTHSLHLLLQAIQTAVLHGAVSLIDHILSFPASANPEGFEGDKGCTVVSLMLAAHKGLSRQAVWPARALLVLLQMMRL